MAEKSLIRRIIAVFDRDSARKAEAELEQSLGSAGAKGGENFLRELKRQFDTRTADLKVSLAKGIIDEKEFRKQSDLAAREFNAGLVKGIEGARQAGTLAEREYLKLSRQMKKVGTDGETVFMRLRAAALRFAAGVAAAFSLRAIVDFGRASVQAAIDAERAWASLASTIEATGVHAADVEPELRAAAAAWERTTTHDDDEFIETLQRLIALTGDYAASLQNVGLVADVAARFFNGELAPAADLVGRVMAGNTRGLKQLGIDAKDAGEALRELAARSMGAAADAADTLDGKVRNLNKAWGNFKEAVGGAMIAAGGGTSILDTLTASIQASTKAVDDNRRAIALLGKGLIELGTTALSAAAGPLMTLVKVYERAARVLERLGIIKPDFSTVSGGSSTTATPPPPAVVPPPGAEAGDLDVVVDKHEKAAERVKTVWQSAIDEMDRQAAEERTVLGELADAWSQGGFAGIAALAKAKVRENLARVIEEGALALGALARGNLPAAGAHAKAAAMHVAGAAAWRALAGGGGGGAGGGHGGAGGALSAGAATGLDRAGSANPPATEVHIYLDPLSPQDPRVQSFHHETARMVEERFGANANVTWHPRTK